MLETATDTESGSITITFEDPWYLVYSEAYLVYVQNELAALFRASDAGLKRGGGRLVLSTTDLLYTTIAVMAEEDDTHLSA